VKLTQPQRRALAIMYRNDGRSLRCSNRNQGALGNRDATIHESTAYALSLAGLVEYSLGWPSHVAINQAGRDALASQERGRG
jgi:hypothetical protein